MAPAAIAPAEVTGLARGMVGLPWPIAQDSATAVVAEELGWAVVAERPRLLRTGFGPDLATTSYAYDELASITVYLVHFGQDGGSDEELFQSYGWAVTEYYGEGVWGGVPGKRVQVWDTSAGARLTLIETPKAYALEVASPAVAAGRKYT